MTDFLNWRTDPMLVDPEPIKQNTWLTANDLLESNRRELFITPTGHLLLYPIMVRKGDFVTGERILQSFPYILLDQEWIRKIRKQSLALAEKTHHYFTNSNYTRSIRSWQKKIINYLETQQRLPFPLFRLTNDFKLFFNEKQYIHFQSARGEDFQLPLFLTEDLAYLIGVIMGDGHLADYFVNIIDSSKEHIENLIRLLEELFHSKTEFFTQSNANAWNVNILGKWVVRLVNFLSSQPINARKYPSLREPLIFQIKDLFRRAFWSGLMDADGGYKNNIGFGTASKHLLGDFSSFLLQHNIQHRFYTQTVFGGTTHSLTVLGESRKQFASLIGSNHPQKQKELQTLLKRKIKRFTQQSQTLLRQGVWVGQVLAFNPNKLVNDFFDFTKVPILTILHSGDYIRLLRKQHHHKQKQLASALAITPSLLSRYELSKAGIPIHFLLKLLSFFDISLQSFLTKHTQLSLKLNNSHCRIDTRPNDKLLKLLQGLQCKDGRYFLIIGLANHSLTEYKELLSDYFSITKPKTRKLNNAVLYTLVREFCTIRNGINSLDSTIKES
ncbi:MAG: helix-turn-helix domain-containing protein [Candidatus Heimdallarchaeota archaeon]